MFRLQSLLKSKPTTKILNHVFVSPSSVNIRHMLVFPYDNRTRHTTSYFDDRTLHSTSLLSFSRSFSSTSSFPSRTLSFSSQLVTTSVSSTSHLLPRVSKAFISDLGLKCTGCGAIFQIDKPDHAGYIPPEKVNLITDVVAPSPSPSPAPPPTPVCQRCYKMRQYSQVIPTKIDRSAPGEGLEGEEEELKGLLAGDGSKRRKKKSVDDGTLASSGGTLVDPRKHLKKLLLKKGAETLIVKTIDLFDFEGSFIDNLIESARYRPTNRMRPRGGDEDGRKGLPPLNLFLVGNKVDLLPQGASLDRVQRWLTYAARDRGLPISSPSKVFLVSAKTGQGIRHLMEEIDSLKKKRNISEVHFVGCTNVGKSSLINKMIALVTSDANKQRMMNEYARKVKARDDLQQSSITENQEGETKEEEKEDEAPSTEAAEESLYLQQRDARKAQRIAHQHGEEVEGEGTEGVGERMELAGDEELEEAFFQRRKKKRSTSENFAPLTTCSAPGTTLGLIKIAWKGGYQVVDTPGIVKLEQLCHQLPVKDLEYLTPHQKIVPEIVRLSPGKTIFVGGLLRLDHLEGDPFYFSIFRSRNVVIHPTDTKRALDVYRKHVGTLITPPLITPSPEFESFDPFTKTKEEEEEESEAEKAGKEGKGEVEAEVETALTTTKTDNVTLKSKEENERKGEGEEVGEGEGNGEESRQETQKERAKRLKMEKEAREVALAKEEMEQERDKLKKVFGRKWKQMDLELHGKTSEMAQTDLVVSGLGWVSFSGKGTCLVRCYVPRGVGMIKREPALMPYEASVRGRRKYGVLKHGRAGPAPIPKSTTSSSTSSTSSTSTFVEDEQEVWKKEIEGEGEGEGEEVGTMEEEQQEERT